MKVLKEISQWQVEHRWPNHTYLLEGDKVIAYRKWHDSPAEFFKKPMRFDRARRKFEEMEYDAKIWGEQKVLGHIIRVAGSKGQTYEVNTETKTCSCTGFQFRGHCKHIEQIEACS
jgi:hypothetical protein